MPKASELKRGSIVALSGTPHVVEDLQIQTPSARGGASLYKLRFRNLVTRQKEDRTFKGDDLLQDAPFEKRDVQFSYAQQGHYTFMDLEDYNEFTLSADEIEDQVPYLTTELEGIIALVSDGKVLAIELPPVVELEVTECGPSMKGASATARTKPATLCTGLVVQVPEYLAAGGIIRVDTRTGKFLSRA
jgi:elongation factor P